jgi:Tol biopolymer transport system component
MIRAGVHIAVFMLAVLLAACSGPHPGPATPPAPVSQNQGGASSSQIQTGPTYPPPVIDPPPAPPVVQLACAPCGKIVFTSSRDGNDELYSVNADGTGLTRLTDNPESDDYAAWSPDGTRIAYTSGKDEDAVLVVMNADGSNAVRRSVAQAFVQFPTWSPDGTKITYSAVSDGSLNLWQVDADGGYPLLLFSEPGWDAHAAWAPDGSRIALVSDWNAYDFVQDVFLIDPDGSNFTPVTDGDIFDHVDYVFPSWAPDGAKIAVTMQQEIAIDTYLAYLGVMNRDGSGLKPLIAAAPWLKSSWSPDGTMIAFTSGSGQVTDISWVSVDGSAQGMIVTDGRNPAWQP